jgi:hypothetical protein
MHDEKKKKENKKQLKPNNIKIYKHKIDNNNND